MPAEPAVSVLVLCYNKAAYTRRCLDALRQHTPPGAWELIVLDNGSTDETPALLAELARALPNLTVKRSDTNLGFVRGNNLAAQAARGRRLCLLNNDTEVQPGWLEALLAVMDADPTAGVVGAKLIYPDGRLQEAGGLVFRDGSAWNFGRLDPPDDPEYNYRREADYCSGAALLVRADLFRAAGGFDDRYSPAYWEDVDLCFQARARGYRVVYQPFAQVVHHEGATAGTDVRHGPKRYQQVNGRRFRRQWARALAQQPPAPLDTRFPWHLADRRSRGGRQMLLLCETLPGLAPAWLERLSAWQQTGLHVSVAVRALPEPRLARTLADQGVLVYSLEAEVATGRSPSVWQALAALLQRRRYDAAFLQGVATSDDWRADIRALSPHTEIHAEGAEEYALPGAADRDQANGHAPASRPETTALVEGLTFGAGFASEAAGARWMSANATLFVWHEALPRPRTLLFELACALPETFSRYPLNVSISSGSQHLADVWFRVNHETREVHLPLDPAETDLCLTLTSGLTAEGWSFMLSSPRWLDTEAPAEEAQAPDAGVPASGPVPLAPPAPEAEGDPLTDIARLRDRSAGFREQLAARKRALQPSAGFWYPYDILANLIHLDQLLTGRYRDLAALAGGRPVVDIGAADGDLAFLLEAAGLHVHVIDHAPTNHNGLRGVRLLKNSLGSAVEIHDIDLDAQFTWPAPTAGLALFLGILYHLKNPYYALETLARHANYCVLSTKIAAYLPGAQTYVNTAPVAYLLDALECNNDPTNFWVFTESGLERLVARTGWEMINLVKLGSPRSDPVSPGGDERAFCLLRSKVEPVARPA